MPDGPVLTAIYGSPRHNGNSETLLDSAASRAEAAGAKINRIYLRDLTFVPCQNCGNCSTTGKCRIEDDMTLVYKALDESDIILLAAPIYFCSLAAQTKMMIDRFQPYWARKYVLKVPTPSRRRVGAFICCCGFKDDRFLACTEQIVKAWCFVMHVDYAGNYFVPGLDARGDAERHPSALEGAGEFGNRIVASFQGK